ncbi:catalase-related domain-containing protein [Streptomyces sp. NPDC001795]|uniref:catalase-related domain-containing protein n=1 Tax=unclassified Streptomyces TaxID=2593676 RepID=UPI003328B384
MTTQDGGRPLLTTETGAPVADNQNSETAGRGGPLLVQDQQLFEKLARFKEKERLIDNLAIALARVSADRDDIVERAIDNFRRADSDFGSHLEAGVKERRR